MSFITVMRGECETLYTLGFASLVGIAFYVRSLHLSNDGRHSHKENGCAATNEHHDLHPKRPHDREPAINCMLLCDLIHLALSNFLDLLLRHADAEPEHGDYRGALRHDEQRKRHIRARSQHLPTATWRLRRRRTP